MLLFILTLVYQDMSHEVILKYGGRDISESSLVFSRSKVEEAKSVSHYFQSSTSKNFAIRNANSEIQSKSAYQSRTKDAYTVMGCPLPLEVASQ